MLNDADASGFKKVYLAMGFTDLRRGIDGLATIVRFQFKLDPYDKNTLFLFCGRRCDRIKALLWEGDGFLLMYKRLDNGAFRWPRSAETAKANNLKPFDYFEYLLTEIPKHVDDKNIDFLAELLPWSDMLPENIRKPQKASGK